MKKRITAVALTLIALCGTGIGEASADPGTRTYSDTAWSVQGYVVPGMVCGSMGGSGLWPEDGGYTGLTSWVVLNTAECHGLVDAYLYRDLSWVSDGWDKIATSKTGLVRDNKRYRMNCDDWIQFRLGDEHGNSYKYSAKRYPLYDKNGRWCG